MNTAQRTPDVQRKCELATIHAAATKLAMGDDAYRSMLERVTGLRSAKDMDPSQRRAVIDELKRLGGRVFDRGTQRAAYQRKFKGRPTRVAPELESMMKKVGALLTVGQKPWAYAHAMAARMFSVQRVEWLNPEQMHKLIAALAIGNRREAKKDKGS